MHMDYACEIRLFYIYYLLLKKLLENYEITQWFPCFEQLCGACRQWAGEGWSSLSPLCGWKDYPHCKVGEMGSEKHKIAQLFLPQTQVHNWPPLLSLSQANVCRLRLTVPPESPVSEESEKKVERKEQVRHF